VLAVPQGVSSNSSHVPLSVEQSMINEPRQQWKKNFKNGGFTLESAYLKGQYLTVSGG
jgi:hypothetical protein